ncbi:hypothetical protein F0Q45_07500 [Mycobacterium simiae]|uniref:DUF732 domain-containing protein n=1 Tax=Mycobacterium simiae TaxID=1784 RepID=A0A5B1BRY1_MYCSI|nr:hypothetical protein [Mycobacterium simiae]KAA1250812.1 hypothetical protein F0Q45_07500 [Mycobacterium simiae]
MTDNAATSDNPRSSRWHRTTGQLSRLALGMAAATTLIVSAPALADTAETGPSYQLGYTKAVKDGRFTVSRMRAMGFPEDAINLSDRVNTVCAKELSAMQSVNGVNGPDFLRGCESGVQSLVDAGLAS